MTNTTKQEQELAKTIRRNAFTAGLRALADFLDAHPTVPHPHCDTMNVFLDSREEIAAVARAASWEKSYQGNWFSLVKAFGEDLSLEINTHREAVCRKVVTGTRVVPAVEAQPEREEPVEEWVCDEGLLAGGR